MSARLVEHDLLEYNGNMFYGVHFLILQLIMSSEILRCLRVRADPAVEITCGFDPEKNVTEGHSTDIDRYSWLGILYYVPNMLTPDNRLTTTAVLIAKKYALVSSFDVGNIPASKIVTHTRLIFGSMWTSVLEGEPVADIVFYRNYESSTLTTLAIAYTFIHIPDIIPICLPKHGYILGDAIYQVSISNYYTLSKEVKYMKPVRKKMCKKYYVDNKLYIREMRPLFGVCAKSSENKTCLIDSGTVLVSRDPFGAWVLIGLGVRGPGCAAPAEYIDVYKHTIWTSAVVSGRKTLSMFRIDTNHVIITKNWYADEEAYNNPDYDSWHTRDQNGSLKQDLPQKERVYGHCKDAMRDILSGGKDKDVVYHEKQVLMYSGNKKGYIHAYYRIDLNMATYTLNCLIIKVDALKGARKPIIVIDNFCDAAPGRACHAQERTSGSLELNFKYQYLARVNIIFVGKSSLVMPLRIPLIYPRREDYINKKYDFRYSTTTTTTTAAPTTTTSGWIWG